MRETLPTCTSIIDQLVNDNTQNVQNTEDSTESIKIEEIQFLEKKLNCLTTNRMKTLVRMTVYLDLIKDQQVQNEEQHILHETMC